ncbi:MAG: hypothetical protein ACRDFC_04845 [Ignavibacteria bacterium]
MTKHIIKLLILVFLFSIQLSAQDELDNGCGMIGKPLAPHRGEQAIHLLRSCGIHLLRGNE